MENSQPVGFTINDVLNRLQQRVTLYDAHLILNSAMILSGVRKELTSPLGKEEATNLCMELINRGGPAFQVGTAIYREMLQ